METNSASEVSLLSHRRGAYRLVGTLPDRHVSNREKIGSCRAINLLSTSSRSPYLADISPTR